MGKGNWVIKTALKVTVGSQTVFEEVLHTILVEMEGILNPKPIRYASSDMADTDPITPKSPSHGAARCFFSTGCTSQILAHRFWSCFIKNYLPNLQVRNKWQKDTQTLKEGTVVLIMDPQLPRGLWSCGKSVTHHTQS